MKTRFILSALLFLVANTLFAQTNLLSGWAGNGDTNNTTSYPNNYGWVVNPGSFNYANSTSGIRWIDITQTSNPLHKLNGNNYAGRLMMLRWDGAGSTSLASVYSIPVTLTAGKKYNFSWIYEWWNNANAPILTVGVSNSRDIADNIFTKDFQCSSTKNQLTKGSFVFTINEPKTYYITIKANNLAALCALGELNLTEAPPSLESNISSVELNYFNKESSFHIYPNNSTDIITLSAPAGIKLNPASLPASGGDVTASTLNMTNVSGNIVVKQGTEEINIPVAASFPTDFTPPTVSNIADEGAWCWFADPRALYYENSAGTIKNSYIGYIDIHGALKATQINHIANTKNEVLIRSYFQPDDHNNPTFLALPDGRIMIFYSRHTDESCFYYRVSQKPGDITSLGQEVRLTTANNTTYPSPFILSDDPNHIYLCWRGINWHPTIARMPIPQQATNDVVDFDWGPKQIVQSTGARPYAKYSSNGKDKIYMTYTTGHPDNESPNYVYFNQININSTADNITLSDVKGKILSNINNGAHNVNKSAEYVNTNPNAVVDNSSSRDWVWEVSMDNEGKPAIAMVRINETKTSHDYYFAKWTGTEWRKTFLENGGGHFHQTAGLELCYSGGMAIDDANANIIYCSVPINGKYGKVYEIVKYTLDDNGTIISRHQVTGNSQKNNIRPYVVNNSGNRDMLVWMYGDYYDWIVSATHPKGYSTGIRAGFSIPETSIDLNNALVKHENFDNASGFSGNATIVSGNLAVSPTKKATITAPAANSFSIVLSPYIDKSKYSGEILNMGNLSFGINQENPAKPYLKIGTTNYASSNVLGNSDIWTTLARGTSGNWPSPTKFKFFSLAISYENGVLTTYINGLIDQQIEIAGLTLADITLGGFTGYVNDIYIYNRKLNQDEIAWLQNTWLSQTNYPK